MNQKDLAAILAVAAAGAGLTNPIRTKEELMLANPQGTKPPNPRKKVPVSKAQVRKKDKIAKMARRTNRSR